MRTERLQRLLEALDLTRLEAGDPEAAIETLCRRAHTPFGRPAAVCVLPDRVGVAKRTLADADPDHRILLATVANFPAGDDDVAAVTATVEHALEACADEIDVVLPWRALRDGRPNAARRMLEAVRRACGPATMKVIVETGALTNELVDHAAALAIDCGADFLKTSTGKGPTGATPEAASLLIDRIEREGAVDRCGLKVSGGIRTIAAAEGYLALAERRLGPDWPTPSRFRIGASGLFDVLLDALGRTDGELGNASPPD
ncbi:deoxyribose-phosphate aldolase [Halomonas denitrificans]|nr:deoxyribose-phosphate aldolase [Halomonas denitrificans]